MENKQTNIDNQVKSKTKKNNNLIILLLVVVLVIVVAVVLFLTLGKNNDEEGEGNGENTENGITANTAAEVVADVNYEGLAFTNISLITDNGYTTFSADVTNITSEVVNMENVNINLKDADGNVIVTLIGNIGNDLRPNETRTITSSAKIDTVNVVSKEITK